MLASKKDEIALAISDVKDVVDNFKTVIRQARSLTGGQHEWAYPPG